MPSIKQNLHHITSQINQSAQGCGRDPESVVLVAVSKKKSTEQIVECVEAGGTHLGENYIQEAVQKIDKIGKDRACWHFIGHLQSNKARFAVHYFEYIHTVDTVKLALEINKWAHKINKVQKILLQANIADEQTKSGAGTDELIGLAKQVSTLENVSIQGLMCMPPFFDDPEQARPYFKTLVSIRDQIKALKLPSVSMEDLCMGMRIDFMVGIEEGATMVRVGTSIFGSRF